MIYIAQDHFGTVSDLNHPRFCFHKWPVTVTATPGVDGADEDWLDDGDTWSLWQASSGTATITLAFGQTRAIDYVGIAAHDLDEAGSSVTIEVDTGTGYATHENLSSIAIDDDSALLFFLGPIEVDGVRISISGGTAPTIGVAQAGLSMELPRMSSYTALPISESDQTRLKFAQAVKGAVLGQVVEGAELAFSIDIQHLSEDFRRATGDTSWANFRDHVRNGKPFFVASKPRKYPDDVAYGVAREQVRFNRAIAKADIAGEIGLDFLGYKRP